MAPKTPDRRERARGMDAVALRTQEFNKPPKKRPILRKKGSASGGGDKQRAPKGPGLTLMIAVGTPKPAGKGPSMPQNGERPKSKEDVIARLEARIAQLEAKLAEDEGEMEEEGEEEGYEDEETED